MSNINDYGFPFSSVTEDRQYSASDWREYFKNFMPNGIIKDVTDELEVEESATPAKSVLVNKGAIVISGATRIVDATETLDIDENTSGNPRIDRIVARLTIANREITLAVLKGTAAGSPVAPTLTQTDAVYEISLAQIALANGYSTIENAVITDERSYCVTSLITSLLRTAQAEKTSNFTFALTDETQFIKCLSSSAIVGTIPTNATVPFPVNVEIPILRYGTGTVTITPAATVTLNGGSTGIAISAQYRAATIKQMAADTWIIVGAV